MEDIEKKESKRFFPGDSTNVVPLMRDVFTIPTSSRKRPKLIGSFCKECEEHFFPKTGSKATCYYPSCPRSTTEVMFGEKGKLLSANVTRVSMDSTQERVSAVIMLDEGIRINSHLIDWEEFKAIDFRKLSKKKKFKIFDMRNLYSPILIKKLGLDYYSIGR